MQIDRNSNGVCILEVSWINGLFVDFIAFDINDMNLSLFCAYLSLDSMYLEIFGVPLIDTT